tara:strand:+ start:6125 stop:6469 length:345 start_codon:yes stop_codon:yes gene_type:complete
MTELPVLIILGVLCLVAAGALWKVPAARNTLGAVGSALVAAAAAIVFLRQRRKENAGRREAAQTVKQGREAAKADAERTEAALEDTVSVETVIHEQAQQEQDSLKEAERPRVKA